MLQWPERALVVTRISQVRSSPTGFVSAPAFFSGSHATPYTWPVIALVGNADKVMRPVVKPNQGSASADAAEPLPIHIDVLPDCMVQVTTSSVFDVHLVDHLAQPDQYMVNDNFAVLGRMVAIVHEEIDFCQSPPVHRRRLNLSLMELEASSAVRQ